MFMIYEQFATILKRKNYEKILGVACLVALLTACATPDK